MFTFTLGSLQSYSGNTGDNTSVYGLILASYSDGDGGRSAIKIEADRNVVIDAGDGQVFFTDSVNGTVTLSDVLSSGGGTAVFG